MVTGLAEGEAVCELIRRLAALACRAISPSFLCAANVKSCTDWADKALWGKSVRFGSTNSPQVPQRCQRLVSVKPPSRSGACVYQASGTEKYCLAHVCFGLDISAVFTWESLTPHLENNDVEGGQLQLGEKDIKLQGRVCFLTPLSSVHGRQWFRIIQLHYHCILNDTYCGSCFSAQEMSLSSLIMAVSTCHTIIKNTLLSIQATFVSHLFFIKNTINCHPGLKNCMCQGMISIG